MTKTHSAAQRRAIECNDPAILVIAGPGSGKTTTVVSRIQRLLTEGVSPRTIIAITFTNAAAKELLKRLAGPDSDQPPALGYIGTLHGFCLRELQRHGSVLGYGRRITVLDAEQSDELLIECAQSVKAKGTIKTLKIMRQIAATTKGGWTLATPNEIAVATYFRRLRQVSAVDFDTILTEYLALLRTDLMPSEEWQHLIVDEYQDSSAIDTAIYFRLPVANRFFVGDPDQAIYGFRGGEVRHILELSKHEDVTTILLDANYRCAPAICYAANRLIGHNRNRIEKTTVPVFNDTDFGSAQMINEASDDEEASFVAKAIQWHRDLDGTAPMEIAVLTRNNREAAAMAKAAELRGIPIRKKKPLIVPEDWSKARLSVDLLNDPGNEMIAFAWIRATHGDEMAKTGRLSAAKAQLPLRCLIPASQRPPPRESTIATLPEDLARMGISRESIELVMEHADALPPGATLMEVSFSIARDLEAREEMGDGVTFTTIHSAKGREWDIVFLAGWEQELFPGNRAGDAGSQDRIEEERRLAFVGLTRARKCVVISHAKKRRQPWGDQRHADATPSQFIQEALG